MADGGVGGLQEASGMTLLELVKIGMLEDVVELEESDNMELALLDVSNELELESELLDGTSEEDEEDDVSELIVDDMSDEVNEDTSGLIEGTFEEVELVDEISDEVDEGTSELTLDVTVGPYEELDELD
jgi:hypothetical protein